MADWTEMVEKWGVKFPGKLFFPGLMSYELQLSTQFGTPGEGLEPIPQPMVCLGDHLLTLTN